LIAKIIVLIALLAVSKIITKMTIFNC
jgi:hypothetical protein